MPGDERRNLAGAGMDDIVPAAAHHMELRLGQETEQALAHRHRTDRIASRRWRELSRLYGKRKRTKKSV